MKSNKYTFNKIKYKHEKKLQPGEKLILLDGTEEDIDILTKKYELIFEARPTYGRKPRFEAWGKLQQRIYDKKPEINSVLDIGTGYGTFCEWAYNHICENIYGLDFASSMPEEYIELGVKFIKAPAHDIPLPDKSIDLITSFDFLEHVHPEYLEKTISEMKRVGCRYIFNKVANQPSAVMPYFSNPKWKDLLKQKDLPENTSGQLHTIQEHRTFWENKVFIPEFKSVEFVGGGCYFIEI